MGTMDIDQEILSILHLAISDHQAGRLHEAEQRYRSILGLQPGHADANHNLGVIAVQVNQAEAGLPHFSQALKTNPNQAQYWISCIDALIRSNKLQEAQQLLAKGQLHGLKGDAVDQLVKRIGPDRMMIDPPRSTAQAGLEKSEGVNSPNSSLNVSSSEINSSNKKLPVKSARQPNKDYLNPVISLMNKGKYQEAAIQAKKITEKYPAFGPGFKILGFLLTKLGNQVAAKSALISAAHLLPNDPEVHYNLAVAHQELKNYSEAEKSYRLSIQLKPKFAEAYNNLGQILEALDRNAEVEPYFRQALSLRPNSPEALNNLGNFLKEQKQTEQAESYLRKALSIRPNYAEACNNLGNLLRELKQVDQAEQYYRRALSINTKYAEAYNNLANLQKEDRGLLDDAIKNYKLAHDNKPEEARFLLSLGHSLLSKDEINDAIVAYQKATNLRPISAGLEAAAYMAVLYFIDGADQQSRKYLDFSREISTKPAGELKNSQIYWRFINYLLSWHKENNSLANHKDEMAHLYVIGESHSLSAHRLRVRFQNKDLRCKTEWIPGCKQWHLGNASVNEYKLKFEAIIERIPRESLVLLCIGEIDCRHDEGVISAWQKNPARKVEEIIETTIRSYLTYVTTISEKYKHTFIISGIPAPNIQMDTLAKENAELLVKVIGNFNSVLKNHALKLGLKFLDVYTLTALSNGISNQQYHLDSHHLTPSAIIAAFEHHLVSGIKGSDPFTLARPPPEENNKSKDLA